MVQQLDQRAEFCIGQVAELHRVHASYLGIEVADQIPASFGERRVDEPTVLGAPNPAHQSCCFHAVQQAGDVRHPRDESLCNLIPTESDLSRSAEDPEDVVLRQRETAGAEDPVEAVVQDCLSPGQTHKRFLGKAGGRFLARVSEKFRRHA